MPARGWSSGSATGSTVAVIDPGGVAIRRADQLPPLALGRGLHDVVGRDLGDAPALHVRRGQLRAEELVREDHDLQLHVGTLDVGGRVGLGVPSACASATASSSVHPDLHLAEDVVARAVQDAAARRDPQARERLLGEPEHGRAADHGALVLEAHAVLSGDAVELGPGQRDGALVRRRHRLARLEGGADVRHGRLAVDGVGEGGLHHDVGRGVADDVVVTGDGASPPCQPANVSPAGICENGVEVDAVGLMSDPSRRSVMATTRSSKPSSGPGRRRGRDESRPARGSRRRSRSGRGRVGSLWTSSGSKW